jgi:amino acid transporter
MRRVLGLADLLVIAAAAIGPGFALATTMGPMVGAGGYAAPLALLIVTGIMACVAIGYARMGALHPNAGSSYTWIRLAFGPTLGAYGAWVLVVANVFAIVVTAIPAGTYTLDLIAPRYADSPSATAGVAALWTIAAGVLLARGLKPTALVTMILVIAEFAVLAAVAVAALLAHAVPPAATTASAGGVTGFVGAIVIGIWMIDGWEVSASTAEEATDVAVAPGLGGLGGLALTAGILVLCMTAFLRIGTPATFAAHSTDVMAYVGTLLGGGPWRTIIAVTVLVSLAASLQTTLVYLSRSIFAMGRDGFVPGVFGRARRPHRRNRRPHGPGGRVLPRERPDAQREARLRPRPQWNIGVPRHPLFAQRGGKCPHVLDGTRSPLANGGRVTGVCLGRLSGYFGCSGRRERPSDTVVYRRECRPWSPACHLARPGHHSLQTGVFLGESVERKRSRPYQRRLAETRRRAR